MSYMPFLGGKRICLGKTFAESTSKMVGPKVIMSFSFEYVDSKFMKMKPSNNIQTLHEPEVMVRIIEAQLF